MGGFFLIFILGPHFLPWPATAALYAPLAGLSAWYLVKHAGRLGNDRAKIAFALGMTLVFVPIDIGGELSGNVGVLVFTALTLVILIGLRRRRGARYHFKPRLEFQPPEVVPSRETAVALIEFEHFTKARNPGGSPGDRTLVSPNPDTSVP